MVKGEGEKEGESWSGGGVMVNSACGALDINGLDYKEAGDRVTAWQGVY